MNKGQLKNYIQNLGLENGLEELIFEIIDDTKEVNQTLLSAIANLLDMQAEFYEKTADILEQETNIYEDLANKLDLLDTEGYRQRVEAIAQNEEELLADLNQKIEEIKGNQPPVEPTPTPNTTPQSPTAANI